MKFAPGEDSQPHLPVGGNVGNDLDRLPHVAFLAWSKEPALIWRNVDLKFDWATSHGRSGHGPLCSKRKRQPLPWIAQNGEGRSRAPTHPETACRGTAKAKRSG